jgi:hypothetical protein
LLVVVLAAACGSARLIHQDQEGGVIQLEGDRSQAMSEAVSLMTLQCGSGNFHLMSQGEEPDGVGSANITGPLVAWRIHYACGGSAQ